MHFNQEDYEAMERPNGTKFQGNPLTLIGPELRVGEKAPAFTARTPDLKPFTLEHTKGKIRLFSAVPSLDTPICDMETRRFNAEAANLGDKVEIVTISMDLPFAQKRWCGAAGIDRVQTLSDYQERSFALAYGVLIKELKLLSRSIFVIDAGDVIRYIQHVPEVTNEPDYAAVLGAAKALL